jgi:hypothetical protein
LQTQEVREPLGAGPLGATPLDQYHNNTNGDEITIKEWTNSPDELRNLCKKLKDPGGKGRGRVLVIAKLEIKVSGQQNHGARVKMSLWIEKQG